MPAPYRRRLVDSFLDDFQPQLAAVSLYGPKGVGKTATAERRSVSRLRLDQSVDLARLRADPDLITTLPGPLLVDEWQRFPEVWDLVRRAVDDGAPDGRFLLTGSSAPRGASVHSGAGRIVGVRLRPLSLAERGLGPPTVSLAGLLAGEAVIEGETDLKLGDYVEEITASGFPAIRPRPPRLRRVLLDAYLDHIVHKEFAEQGYPVRRPEALRAWLAAYGAASSTTASYTTILDAATPNQADKPSQPSTVTYRDALSDLWLLDPTPAWSPSTNLLGRMGQADKHQLADPALAARLLDLDASALLTGDLAAVRPGGGAILGALFESLVSLNVKVCAQAAEARVGHLRDRNGRHEVDLIVEGAAGRVVALEVKLAAAPDDHDVRHLLWLKERLGSRVIDLAVVTTGAHAYRRQDGVAVIPAALLGP